MLWFGRIKSAPDLLAAALAPLSAGQATGNIATNTAASVQPIQPIADSAAWRLHYVCKDPGYTGGDPAFGTSSNDAFSFGSGAWAGAHRKYILGGGGGHTNGACAESYAFDAPTLTWQLRDLGATLARDSYEDATAPVQATDANGYRAWPNANGRYCPLPCHVYASLDYDPVNDLVCVFGGGSYTSGQGAAGGVFCIDGATGHWNQDYIVAATGRVEANCFWLVCDDASIRVFCSRNNGNGDAVRADPIGGSAQESALSIFADHKPGTVVGCIIDDPGNVGRKAYAYYNDATHLAYIPNADVVGNVAANGIQISYGNSKPAAVTGNSTWMHLPGWSVIAVFQPNDGLYVLSLDDYTWSAKLLDDPNPAGATKIYRRIFPMPEYGAFGLFTGNGGEFRAIKYPTEIV